MDYRYTDPAIAQLFDDVTRVREVFTGLRNGPIEDGWSHEAAEQAIIAAIRVGQKP